MKKPIKSAKKKAARKMPLFAKPSANTLEAFDRARPFEPSPGGAMREYIDSPRRVIDDRAALSEWSDRGASYVA